MSFEETSFAGLYVIHPHLIADNRGYFLESFNENEFKKTIPGINFVQDNESKSSYGVLRGLHFQNIPYEQTKLVRVVQGEVLDVAVDLRKDSKTFGKHFTIILNDSNKKQLFIPKGFAHGFVVLSEEAIFSYKVDAFYNPESEGGIIWSDTDLAIDWKIRHEDVLISDKDKKLMTLKKYLEK